MDREVDPVVGFDLLVHERDVQLLPGHEVLDRLADLLVYQMFQSLGGHFAGPQEQHANGRYKVLFLLLQYVQKLSLGNSAVLDQQVTYGPRVRRKRLNCGSSVGTDPVQLEQCV